MTDLTWRSKVAAPLVILAIALVAWQLSARAGWIPPYVLPAPTEIARRIFASVPFLATHALVTTVEILLGFGLATLIGIGLAIVVVYFPSFEASISPWLVVSQVIPKVAIGPLFMVWFGFGLLPKVVIAFLIAFFPILVDTVIGLKSVERESVFLLQSMGAGRWKIFRYLLLPNALPNIFVGMKVGMTLAIVGAVVGEFVGANQGLGYLLLYANGTMDSGLLFSALVVLSGLALLLYAIIGVLQMLCVSWHVSQRPDAGRSTM
jgi:NitT/TauT family transport system permease protein